MRNKNIVITGGAGFIGSNLAKSLVEENNILIIDNLSTGRLENIKDIIHRENLVCIQGSILNRSLLEKSFRGIDYVFHHAAIASVSGSIDDPAAVHETNITGTLNVLLAAKKNHVRKVVFASSASVYGDSANLPQNENMVPNLLSPYALTKLVGEYYCEVFYRIYNLPTICLRYFNVYGPHQDPNSEYAAVIPSFISNALKNKPPVIYGDGTQTRDFIFVEDVVEANIMAAECGATGVYNVGSGTQTAVNTLLKNIAGILHADITPVYQQARIGEIKDSLADITRAISIGYRPHCNLEYGLKETINGFANSHRS